MSGTHPGLRHNPESIAYIRQMLGELRIVAEREGAQMLCYLIEMAFEEAGDLQMSSRNGSISKGNGDKPTGMPV